MGSLRVAVTAMANAVKAVTTERGLDPGGSRWSPTAGGAAPCGGGGARDRDQNRDRSDCTRGVLGVRHAVLDLRYDYVRTWFTRLEDAPFERIERVYRDLRSRGRTAIAGASVEPRRMFLLKRAADMRYVGQEHAVTVDLPLAVFAKRDRAAIKRYFDAMHARRYGTSAPEEPAEIVSLRTTVTGVMRKPPHQEIGRGGRMPDQAAFTGKRPAYFDGRFRQTPTTRAPAGRRQSDRRAGVDRGARSTTVLLPGDRRGRSIVYVETW